MVFGEAVICFDGGYELGSFGQARQTSSTETTTTVLHKRVAFVIRHTPLNAFSV